MGDAGGGFDVVRGEGAVDHEFAQVVFDGRDPAAGRAGEEAHELVAVERALQLGERVLGFQPDDPRPEAGDPLRRRPLLLLPRRGDVGRGEIEQIVKHPVRFKHQAAHGALCLAVWIAVALGHGAEVFALYVIPATIARLMIGIFLSWLPHAPWLHGDRHPVALLRRNRLLALFAVGHHLHLIHHLWPRVPFYRYPALYRSMAPLLHDRGVKLR